MNVKETKIVFVDWYDKHFKYDLDLCMSKKSKVVFIDWYDKNFKYDLDLWMSKKSKVVSVGGGSCLLVRSYIFYIEHLSHLLGINLDHDFLNP